MFNKNHDKYFTLDSKGNKIGIGIDIALAGYPKESININTTSNSIRVFSDGVVLGDSNRKYVDPIDRIDRNAFSVEYLIDDCYDLDKLTASFKDGVLSILVPATKQKIRTIKIS